jgi:hypothetical protein
MSSFTMCNKYVGKVINYEICYYVWIVVDVSFLLKFNFDYLRPVGNKTVMPTCKVSLQALRLTTKHLYI